MYHSGIKIDINAQRSSVDYTDETDLISENSEYDVDNYSCIEVVEVNCGILKIYGSFCSDYPYNHYDIQSVNTRGDVFILYCNDDGCYENITVKEFREMYESFEELDDYLIEDELSSSDNSSEELSDSFIDNEIQNEYW
jgi:hypothetical protein